jgi:hypothetical protein
MLTLIPREIFDPSIHACISMSISRTGTPIAYAYLVITDAGAIMYHTAQKLLMLPTVKGTTLLVVREWQTFSQTATSQQEEDLNPCDFALHDTYLTENCPVVADAFACQL